MTSIFPEQFSYRYEDCFFQSEHLSIHNISDKDVGTYSCVFAQGVSIISVAEIKVEVIKKCKL